MRQLSGNEMSRSRSRDKLVDFLMGQTHSALMDAERGLLADSYALECTHLSYIGNCIVKTSPGSGHFTHEVVLMISTFQVER